MSPYLLKISKFFLYVALFSVIFVSTETLFPFIVTKYVFFRLTVGLAFIFFLFGWFFVSNEEKEGFEKRLKERFFSPLVIAVSVFTAAFLLACAFGFNPDYSFWSNFERGEGGFQLLAFYIFFLLLVFLFKDKKDWWAAFKTFLAVAVIMILYGLLAGLGVPGFAGVSLDIGQRFQGSLGNTAYVGTFLLFSIFYALYLIFNGASSRRTKVFLWLLVLTFLIIIWLTQTRGPFLGLGAGVFAFVLFCLFKGEKKIRRVSVVIFSILLILSAALYQLRYSPVMQKLALTRFFNITFSNLSTQSRIWSWEAAIKGWQERPVFGWGPENYGRLFDKYFDTRYFMPGEQSDTWYDRAHSVIFDYLAETGIVGLLSYLGIFVTFFFVFFRREKESTESLVLQGLVFAMPVAYLVQGLVIFDVLPIYLNLFLFLAFAQFLFNRKES